MSTSKIEIDDDLFNRIKDSIISIDPVTFCEKYLTLDGEPFRLNGNGYKPFADIYRYIGVKALDRDSKPVVLVKGRQVGATTMAAALEMYFMTCGLFGDNRPPMRMMHCFPQLELAFAYSKTKLKAMISASKLIDTPKGRKAFVLTKLDKSTSTNDSLNFKQFIGGNHLFVDSLGLTADRVRGRSLDAMFVDEVQDMKGPAIGNAIKVLSQSKYGRVNAGIQVYFGTPKQHGTEYWKIWNKSSQQYYHLGCEKCEKHFPLYTPGSDEWERIWLYGYIVKCTHCGHEQNKLAAQERGKWVPYNTDEEGLPYIGYHINQLYMPLFTKEDIIAQKPENNPLHTERIYQNEILGEFFAGDASPITPEEIEEKCADRERKMRRGITPSNNIKVYLGCDWGAKADISQLTIGDREQNTGGQSYSCAVVLVADGPHILSIDFALRLKRNDLATKKGTVEEIMRRYSVDRACGDIGFANDLTELLQKEYGSKFLASQAASRVNGRAKFKNDYYPHTIVFEKDYYYAEVYDLMKSGRIRFPFGDYEKILWLIDHCCSMELKPTQDRSGDINVKYVKGSTPNDGFAALVNAYLAYKYDVTSGFTIHNPNLMKKDPSKKEPPLAISVYLPGLNSIKRAR